MEEEEGAAEEVEGNPSCEKEKEKKNEENEKERENEEEAKEKDQANGKGEESEGEVFLLENLGYRGYREDVLKDRLRSPIDNLHTQKNADKTLFFTATTDTAYHTSILMCENALKDIVRNFYFPTNKKYHTRLRYLYFTSSASTKVQTKRAR